MAKKKKRSAAQKAATKRMRAALIRKNARRKGKQGARLKSRRWGRTKVPGRFNRDTRITIRELQHKIAVLKKRKREAQS